MVEAQCVEEWPLCLHLSDRHAALQMRALPEILKSEAAREALGKKGYDAAYKVLVKDKPAMTSDLFSLAASAAASESDASSDRV